MKKSRYWCIIFVASSVITMISAVYVRGAVADQIFVLSVLELAVLGILGYARLGPEPTSLGTTSMSASAMDVCQCSPSSDVPKLISTSIATVAGRADTVFQDLAQLRLIAISVELQHMASGQLVFTGSESWRTAYERILRSPGLGRYQSVAWLRTEDYWRDAPGRRSIRLNYDLAELGLRIERIVILNDFFWAPGALVPAKTVLSWLVDQHKHGIGLRLIRESEIESETDLLGDFGIYGDRAVGRLDLDNQCRSLHFTLDFNPQGLRLAEDRWRRLELFAVSFREVLDRGAQGRYDL